MLLNCYRQVREFMVLIKVHKNINMKNTVFVTIANIVNLKLFIMINISTAFIY
jgi:hypothetical protein